MIDAGPSLQAARGLTGAALVSYLVARGWTARPSRIDGISILSKEVPGADGPAEFIVPVKPGWEDEQRRIADALRTIEVIERRSLAEIANEIRSVLVKPSRVAAGQTAGTSTDAPATLREPDLVTDRDIVVMISMIDYLFTEISRIDPLSAEHLRSARDDMASALAQSRGGAISSESEPKVRRWLESRRSSN